MSVKDNLRIILVLMALMFSVMFLSYGCERKCRKGSVKMNGKCYEIGATYSLVNGEERMV